jgi:hypothetical protein
VTGEESHDYSKEPSCYLILNGKGILPYGLISDLGLEQPKYATLVVMDFCIGFWPH